MDSVRALMRYARGIDHIAIAVPDLDQATEWYTVALGMTAEEEKVAHGVSGAMRSRVMRAGGLKFVLVQGTNPQSNVSRYIQAYGPGVQHVALLVDDIEAVVQDLQPVGFDTHVISGPHLKQAFTHRDEISGMVFELVQRTDDYDGFQDNNVQQLLDALESKENF